MLMQRIESLASGIGRTMRSHFSTGTLSKIDQDRTAEQELVKQLC
jgi:hypothetical protein